MGSLSLTLDALFTETTLQFDKSLDKDRITLNGRSADEHAQQRISRFLDRLAPGSARPFASVRSSNNFPTGAGLASSASGFAALTLAAAHAARLNLTDGQLSALARTGSGSAARSIYGGFAEMLCGSDPGGDNDYAVPLHDDNYWDLRMMIGVTSTDPKELGSTEGMNRTAKTAPYYNSWVQSHPSDLKQMKRALAKKDFEKVGELTEHSCFKMHGLAMAANPPILYWNAATTETIHTIWNLRRKGVAAYVTIDAGPQVKVLCLPESAEIVKQAIYSVKGVKSIIDAKPGPAASIVTPENEFVK